MLAVFLDTDILLLAATAPAGTSTGRAGRSSTSGPNRGVRLCVSGQILREYLVVATRDAQYNGLGLSIADSVANVEAFTGRCKCLAEGPDVAERLREVPGEVSCSGKQIHDANVMATALTQGVPRLVTANTADFERFGKLVEVIPPTVEAEELVERRRE